MAGIAAFLILGVSKPAAAGPLIIFNDNGGWCWYQDERVIVHGDKLVIGSVANGAGAGGSGRNGDIEVTAYNLSTQTAIRTNLHDNFQGDDHDAQAFLPLPDGRILAMYTKHLSDRLIHQRITTNPYDTAAWGPDIQLTRGASTSYSNLFRLSSENGGNGRIYDFYRGENYNPNFIISNDNGVTWTYGGWLIRKDGQRPYVKYASNDIDTVYFVCSNAHPREYYNGGYGGTSIYAGYLFQGGLYKMDGTKVRDISASNAAAPESLTLVYPADNVHRAWPNDMHLDSQGRPWYVFSVQVASGGSFNGSDLRYFYARWDGSQMRTYPLAYAGSALYSAENDYAGLAALDPKNPDIVYISTNANPATGIPLISKTDGQRHYEIYRGMTSDGGAAWTWAPITRNSAVDNLRPVVPVWDGPQTILLWMMGKYYTYTNYNTQIVGMFDPEPILSEEPEFEVYPQPTAAPIGGTAIFTAAAKGLAPLNYTWYKANPGDSDIQVGENSSRLILSNIQASDIGFYYCVASNSAGSEASASALLMEADLLAYWPMDGNYADVTGNGYDASAVGSLSFEGGYSGQAVRLSNNSYLKCGNNSSDLSLVNGGTVSAWIKTSGLQDPYASVAGKGRYSWRLCRNGSGNSIIFHFNNINGVEYQANGAIPVVDGKWHHLAGTYDGRSVRLYVDGRLDASAWTSAAVNSTADPVYIGSRSDNPNDRAWDGLIDEVRIYSFAMDAEMIQLLYERGRSCYRFDPYDFNRDCRIDLMDLEQLTESWLDDGFDAQTQVCTAHPEMDLTGLQEEPDCRVDLAEFADLAERWLNCTLIPSSDCP